MQKSCKDENKQKEFISAKEREVLALVSQALFDEDFPVPSQGHENLEWQSLYEECRQQAVPIITYGGVQKKKMPQNIEQQWKKTVIANTYNNFQVTYDHLKVHEMMQEAGVPYVILKGCASAEYYPKPLERAMGDVDFLVKKEDMEKAGSVLKAHGFVPWEQEHICHVVYRKDSSHLEMHFEPAGIPYGKAGERIREYLENIMDQAREIQVEGGTLMVPSAFHHGLILLLHTSHHLVGEGIGLRHLCDWAVFAASLSDSEFTGIFEEKLKAVGLWEFARLITQTCIHYLNAPYRKWVGEEKPELIAGIMADIFSGGNFGRKDKSRVHESYLISNRGKNGVGHSSILGQFFASMNEVVHTNLPKSRKYPVLLPVGWCYYGGRYFLRMIRGKRPVIHIGKTVEGAVTRKELYREFHLFEGEAESAGE